METKPDNYLTEQYILGSILANPKLWDKAPDVLSCDDFVNELNKALFFAMFQLSKRGEDIDLLACHDYLTKSAKIDSEKIHTYLTELVRNCPSSVNFNQYVRMLHKNTSLRQLEDAGMKISMLIAEAADYEPSELIDRAESILFAMSQKEVRGKGPQDASIILARYFDSLDAEDDSISTGFIRLDEMMAGGMRPGELIIIAGRPGMGKTTLGMNIVSFVVTELKKGALVFSLEMTAEALMERIISAQASVYLQKLRKKSLSDEDLSRVIKAAGMLTDNNLKIDPTPALRPSELRARARRIKRKNPNLAVIMVDYLQLMRPDRTHNLRTHELEEISASLKSLAKELNIPVIALAQLNRNSARVENKRPTMSDLRDSGALEQDADTVALIYRDDSIDNPKRGIAELIIDKQRNGETGTIELVFNGGFNKFLNYRG